MNNNRKKPNNKVLSSRGEERTLRIFEPDFYSIALDDHVWLMIAVSINKLQRHRGQIDLFAAELRSLIDFRAATITSWEFDDLNSPMQVERHEM